MEHKVWIGSVPEFDDFGEKIVDEFIDGKLMVMPGWAIMSPISFKRYGMGILGTGKGQCYKKQGENWVQIPASKKF
jgi:hypothetical protein